MILAVLLLQLCLLVFADIPPCEDGVIVFDCPMNSATNCSYPYSFTKDNLTILPDNYECEYQFNVAQGWYSQINIFLNSTSAINGSPAPVVVTDQLQISEDVFSSNYDYFFFVANGGKIKLSTRNSKVQFGFILQWGQYTGSSRSVNVSKFDTQPFLYDEISTRSYKIRADTHVSVTMMPPPDDPISFIRAFMFFDGLDLNSTCIGNGMQLWKSKSQFVSSGNSMTIRYLGDYWLFAYTNMLIQDYEHTKNITTFRGMEFFGDGYLDTLVLDGTNGTSVLQLYDDVQNYSTDVLTQLEGTGTLDVYIGTITANKSNLVASYNTAQQNVMNLPQAIPGKFKTYVASGGKVSFKLSYDQTLFDHTASFGRTGFISSNEYGSYSAFQYTKRNIESGNQKTVAKFKFNIKNADLVGNVTLDVTGWTNNQQVFTRNYNSAQLPTFNLFTEFYAQKLSVVYDNQKQLNNGFYMEFEVDNSSSKFFAWITVLFLLTRAV